jgi:hypothetical protein
MRSIAVAGLVLVLAGCDQVDKVLDMLTPTSINLSVVPCYVTNVETKDGKSTLVATNVMGYRHIASTAVKGQVQHISHCLPCTQAASKGEHMACEGDKEAK